jgi:hypothetical protein
MKFAGGAKHLFWWLTRQAATEEEEDRADVEYIKQARCDDASGQTRSWREIASELDAEEHGKLRRPVKQAC